MILSVNKSAITGSARWLISAFVSLGTICESVQFTRNTKTRKRAEWNDFSS